MKLYIGNIAWTATEADLEAFFKDYEVVPRTAKIIKDKESGRSKGYGFIEVARGEEAIAECTGKELLNRPLRISVANSQASGLQPRRN